LGVSASELSAMRDELATCESERAHLDREVAARESELQALTYQLVAQPSPESEKAAQAHGARSHLLRERLLRSPAVARLLSSASNGVNGQLGGSPDGLRSLEAESSSATVSEATAAEATIGDDASTPVTSSHSYARTLRTNHRSSPTNPFQIEFADKQALLNRDAAKLEAPPTVKKGDFVQCRRGSTDAAAVRSAEEECTMKERPRTHRRQAAMEQRITGATTHARTNCTISPRHNYHNQNSGLTEI
jgi:hypothetical protein